MSTETATAVAPKKESLFSKKNRRLLTDPLDDSNPITVQVLGICSALAITVQVQQAVIMSLAVLFVMIGGNVIISLMRNIIPDRIRIIVQLVVIASLVIIVDEVLKAYSPDISEKLSVFVGLIITNCIIMGRLEAFALGNKPGPAMLDAVGNAMGLRGFCLPSPSFARCLAAAPSASPAWAKSSSSRKAGSWPTADFMKTTT